MLTPARSDVPIAQWAAHALYGPLLRHGVRVYEYQPRVLHAKTLLVDDAWGTVGTANPTLTLSALALRAVDEIRRTLQEV